MLAAVIALVVVIATWFSIREEYWLWRLEVGTDSGRYAACQRLGELRSARAVPGILRFFAYLMAKREGSWSPGWPSEIEDALVAIGEPAIPDLLAALEEKEQDELRATAVLVLKKLGNNEARTVSALAKAAREGSLNALEYLGEMLPDGRAVAAFSET